jgi:hypothetical protein
MKRVLLAVPIVLAASFLACRTPAITQAPDAAVARRRAAAVPESGVYVLRLVGPSGLPADLKPAGYDPRRGVDYERIVAGWLYLQSDSSYQTIICADLVDSSGKVRQTMDRGPSEGRYWVASGQVYFSESTTDAPPDSTAVRVRGDTVEFVNNMYVRDRTAMRPRNLIPAYICPAARDSLGRAHSD